MTIVNHEHYVSLEVAKLLEQAGFDWKCRKIYFCFYEDDDNWELEDNYKNLQRILRLNYCLLAPTLDIAQRWLREVKKINVEVMYLFEPCNYYFARACYLDSNTPLYIPNPPASTIYEEALEAGIKKSLEIILEKQ